MPAMIPPTFDPLDDFPLLVLSVVLPLVAAPLLLAAATAEIDIDG